MPRILREVGGLVIAEDGPLVLVIDRGNGPRAVLAFVAGVVALVFGGFGAVSLAAITPVWLGLAFLAVGVASAAITAVAVRHIRGTRAIPVSDYRPVAVFDRAARVLRDGNGTVVAPLDAVTVGRRMQIGSSAPKLVAQTPAGSFVLLRGNPFTGGLGDLDSVLRAATTI
ncbi:hypothetical protein FHT44_005323 [Mycolicibacterium sp. BK634]|uniref:hypothetical protein n=1 Tax=Mycolicibacterium sp. BK634 TaxID=2587099 RepID=UPI0016165D7A|nr:hypothetical protein [Mycolicibacterium sp. BK634]MBB3752811.1 hypothetical protein [Mycolicibacterium sp. BK634]